MILACANILNGSITQSRQLSLLASAKKVSSNHIVWKGYSGYFLWHVGKDLYEETAKSMEGVLLDEYYGKAKVEGCSFEVMWQDGDSSPENSVTKYHPDGKVYKCGGMLRGPMPTVWKKQRKKRSFILTLRQSIRINSWLQSVSCTRHRAGSGYMSYSFIRFCSMQQCQNPTEFSTQLRNLSNYHVRDIRE